MLLIHNYTEENVKKKMYWDFIYEDSTLKYHDNDCEHNLTIESSIIIRISLLDNDSHQSFAE